MCSDLHRGQKRSLLKLTMDKKYVIMYLLNMACKQVQGGQSMWNTRLMTSSRTNWSQTSANLQSKQYKEIEGVGVKVPCLIKTHTHQISVCYSQETLPHTKELSEDPRSTIVDLSEARQVYKNISQSLDVQVSMVRQIVYKQRHFSTFWFTNLQAAKH